LSQALRAAGVPGHGVLGSALHPVTVTVSVTVGSTLRPVLCVAMVRVYCTTDWELLKHKDLPDRLRLSRQTHRIGLLKDGRLWLRGLCGSLDP
jgi:hypothetical protein